MSVVAFWESGLWLEYHPAGVLLTPSNCLAPVTFLMAKQRPSQVFYFIIGFQKLSVKAAILRMYKPLRRQTLPIRRKN